MQSYIYCVLITSILVLIYKKTNKYDNYKEALGELRDFHFEWNEKCEMTLYFYKYRKINIKYNYNNYYKSLNFYNHTNVT